MSAALVLGALLVGLVARRFLRAPQVLSARVDRLVLQVALPALILARLPDVDLSLSALGPAVAAWGSGLLAVGLVLAGSRRRGWSRPVTGSLLLVTPLGNTSFLGLAVVEVVLGHDALAPALVFDQLGTFLALVTYGSITAARYGGGHAGWAATLRRLASFPPTLAMVGSLVLRVVELPGALDTALGGLGRTVAPLAMLALGLRLALVRGGRVLEPVAWCVTVKMAVMPLVVLAVVLGLGAADGLAGQAAVLQAGMPPMVTAAVVATSNGLDADVASVAVGLGLLVALVTLPLLALALLL